MNRSMLNIFGAVKTLKQLKLLDIDDLKNEIEFVYTDARKNNLKTTLHYLNRSFDELNETINFKSKYLKNKDVYEREQEEIDIISYVFLLKTYNSLLKKQKYNYSVDVTKANRNLLLAKKENYLLKEKLKVIKEILSNINLKEIKLEETKPLV